MTWSDAEADAWSSAALRQAEWSARWGRERLRALVRASLAKQVRDRGPRVEPALRCRPGGHGERRERPVSRRALMGGTAAGALGVAVAGSQRAAREQWPRPPGRVRTAPAGPPRAIGAAGGFRYRIVAEEGVSRLESGEPSPSDPDGAAFARPGGPGSVLVCNHEVSGDEPFPVPHVDGLVYDPGRRRRTTTIHVDADGRCQRQFVSLAGTLNNCAGVGPLGHLALLRGDRGRRDQPHGYVFEVDPYDQAANQDPRPIKALGRFPHEAVVVDPEEQQLYLSEDAFAPNGLLYRWTSPEDAPALGKGVLRNLADDAGVLHAMRATSDGRHVPDLSLASEIGTTYQMDWVTVPDRDATETSVRKQFTDDQVTCGRKLEACGGGRRRLRRLIVRAHTDDGDSVTHDGQVWFLDPRAGTLTLRLRFAPPTTARPNWTVRTTSPCRRSVGS